MFLLVVSVNLKIVSQQVEQLKCSFKVLHCTMLMGLALEQDNICLLVIAMTGQFKENRSLLSAAR